MICIENMTIKYIDEVCNIEKQCFSIPWSRNSFIDEISNKLANYFIIKDNENVIGYIGVWGILDEGHITNIAIGKDYRNNGYGKRLLEKVIEFSKNNGIKSLTLEVRKSNLVAINMYTGFGFKVEGIRKKYYSDNNEDAYIMWKYISEE